MELINSILLPGDQILNDFTIQAAALFPWQKV